MRMLVHSIVTANSRILYYSQELSHFACFSCTLMSCNSRSRKNRPLILISKLPRLHIQGKLILEVLGSYTILRESRWLTKISRVSTTWYISGSLTALMCAQSHLWRWQKHSIRLKQAKVTTLFPLQFDYRIRLLLALFNLRFRGPWPRLSSSYQRVLWVVWPLIGGPHA